MPAESTRTQLRVMAFPQVYAIAIFAADSQSIFEKHGLEVELSFPSGSQELRERLASGDFEVAHAGVDNAVHMVENAGEDVVIVMGGDNGNNSLIVQSYIHEIEDLRGRTLGADAVNTAYALMLIKILALNGIERSEYEIVSLGSTPCRLKGLLTNQKYAGAILTLPFSLLAERRGLRNFGAAADMVGGYQATGAFVQRSWARQNSSTLERYIEAYLEGLRWAVNPANKGEAAAVLAKYLDIPEDVSRESLAIATDPVNGGIARDAAFDVDGFDNVLMIRTEALGNVLPNPKKYYDLSYYQRALQSLNP